ncbi:alpha/beta fold hydrolase [Acinetobacter defluvii]|uniref:alpha/beta fold hydrolase n=1 Tax=Acinetobacter defluvii TaxID=1871111 RepID=UPI003AF6DEDA
MNLIFLPGASGSTDFWQPVKQLLPNHLKKSVLAYPSFGGHPDHAEIQSFEDLQAYVLKHIQQPSVLVAQSMGGIFAVQAALQKPDLVQALVLVVTSGGIDLSSFAVADWREDYQLSFTVPEWFVAHHSDLTEQLNHIQCPVLLIWGDSDPISPVAVGQYLQQKMPNAALFVVEEGQHDLANVHADQVSALILDFIEKIK